MDSYKARNQLSDETKCVVTGFILRKMHISEHTMVRTHGDRERPDYLLFIKIII